MDYELLKRLKDAGFPQTGDGTFYETDEGRERRNKMDAIDSLGTYLTEAVYSPTLEELIEACGETRFSLNEVDGNWLCRGGDAKYTAVLGSSKKEAVANLYLSLNGKEIYVHNKKEAQ